MLGKVDEKEEIFSEGYELNMWTPFEMEVTPQYHFVPKNILFKLVSTILYGIAYPILYVFNKIMFQFTVIGTENLKKIKGGKITVSNHVHPMDCTMCAVVQAPKTVYFPTLKENFQIPVVRVLIKLLHAIPIPKQVEAKQKFKEEIDKLLQAGKTVHFYPEGSLRIYATKIREFKKGAFRFAVENNVPIVPMVYKFKKVTGIFKIWKRKPKIELHILEAIYPDNTIAKQEAIEKLKKQVYTVMKQVE